MKLLLISPKNRTVYNFRGDLIKDIISSGYKVAVTGPDLTDVEKITALGADFREIPMKKNGTSIVGDLKYCKNLYQLIKKENPDITLGYTVKPVIYGAIAAKIAGVKNINGMITGGGYTFTAKSLKAKILGAIVKILYKIGLSVTDMVIFQNPDDMEEFCRKKLVNSKKCRIVNGSGVNTELFSSEEYPPKTVFFMLSRFLKSKGIIEYLEAAKMIKSKYPDTEFKLLGKFEHEMQDAVPEENIMEYIQSGIVEILPETNNVKPFYEACSVYVLPSYREGTPRTVLEAMAMGRPIITTDTNGCRETVKDGINGFLVPVADSKSLASKMEYFLKNPEMIRIMGRKSVEYCKEKFDVKKVNQAMCKHLHI